MSLTPNTQQSNISRTSRQKFIQEPSFFISTFWISKKLKYFQGSAGILNNSNISVCVKATINNVKNCCK